MPYIKKQEAVLTIAKGSVSEHMTLEINTVEGAIEVLKALDSFMFKQRNYIKREDYFDICGDLVTVRQKLEEHLSISSKDNA
ncbi:hypothetical protein IMSAG250_00495 [Clostridiales bacterium]|nr:hypothetical protein IMSAG250_00495 [Clostridiales bacterium]